MYVAILENGYEVRCKVRGWVMRYLHSSLEWNTEDEATRKHAMVLLAETKVTL